MIDRQITDTEVSVYRKRQKKEWHIIKKKKKLVYTSWRLYFHNLSLSLSRSVSLCTWNWLKSVSSWSVHWYFMLQELEAKLFYLCTARVADPDPSVLVGSDNQNMGGCWSDFKKYGQIRIRFLNLVG